jgi:hypothetical protein
VIWQATSYPENNPAPAGELVMVPRGEWIAYSRAWRLDQDVKKFLMFGDYAADSAKFNFATSKGARAIAHFRYSTPDKWLVSRGAKDGKLVNEMPKVATRITSSGVFAGKAFSRGDRYISDVSSGFGTGQARNWRCANVVHHLTRVSADIGTLAGYALRLVGVDEEWKQATLDF